MYPGPKIHRTSRRHLSRGDYPVAQPVTVTVTGAGADAILDFDRPVVVTGNVALSVATLAFASQVINSPTQVTVTMSGAVATHAFTYAAGDPNVATYQGGQTYGASGTF